PIITKLYKEHPYNQDVIQYYLLYNYEFYNFATINKVEQKLYAYENNYPFLIILCSTHFKKSIKSKLRVSLGELERKYKNEKMAQVLMARAHSYLGNTKSAIYHYNRTHGKIPEEEIKYEKGNSYLMKGRHDKAINIIKETQ
ncbi:hypothetical protein ACFL56_03925, partial [Candidatus Margulisiibacteriota bacterium]